MNRLVRQEAKEVDRVEDVGFTHPVCTRDAGERTKAKVDIHQIFETEDLQPS